jgi:predicted ATP-dependent endonuclease of OLD family
MKIVVRNLGIIKNAATIDLKPLTIFIGPNSMGKTWLSYALAGILGPYGSNRFVRAYRADRSLHMYPPLKNAVEQVLAEGSATINLRNFAHEYAATYFNDVASLAREWMSDYLGTQRVRFDTLDFSLSLDEYEAQYLDRLTNYAYRSNIAVGPHGSLLTIQKRRKEDKLYIFTSTEMQDTEDLPEHISEKIPLEEVKSRLISAVSQILHRSLYPQIYAFPTERIATERIVRDNGQLIQVNERIRELLDTLFKELEDAIASAGSPPNRLGMQPTGLFQTMMNDLFAIGTKDRENRTRSANNNPKIRKYIQLADRLQETILAGSIDFSTPEPDPRRELLFHTHDISMELPLASSMVQQLSSLVLYLRYLARPNELLFIDEPEMDLHPKAQAQLIELLAMLVNAGLNVLFTTHSPYITDHLANLIMAAKSTEKGAVCNEFYLKSTDAFLPQEKVAIYGFSGEHVSSILDEDGLINWDTFGKVSEHIINIYAQL